MRPPIPRRQSARPYGLRKTRQVCSQDVEKHGIAQVPRKNEGPPPPLTQNARAVDCIKGRTLDCCFFVISRSPDVSFRPEIALARRQLVHHLPGRAGPEERAIDIAAPQLRQGVGGGRAFERASSRRLVCPQSLTNAFLPRNASGTLRIRRRQSKPSAPLSRPVATCTQMRLGWLGGGGLAGASALGRAGRMRRKSTAPAAGVTSEGRENSLNASARLWRLGRGGSGGAARGGDATAGADVATGTGADDAAASAFAAGVSACAVTGPDIEVGADDAGIHPRSKPGATEAVAGGA